MGKIAELVGKRIKQYRTAKGISQEELAHRADMHASHLGQIERAEKSPTVDSLEKIVNALDITFEELFSFENMPSFVEEPLIEKVVSHLKAMSREEQNDVLKVIRILSAWKEKSKE